MKKSQFKYILLDLDGTLTDPKEGIHACIHYALNALGKPLNTNTNLDWTIGPPLKASLAHLLNTTDEALSEQALCLYRARFSTIGLFENHLYEGVGDVLKQLSDAGYILYVATAKPTVYAKQILAHFNVLSYFKAVYGSELTGERTNKAELIEYLLEQEGLSASACLMVGDREYDILGARKNSIPTIAVTYGYGTSKEIDAATPMGRIEQFKDLLKVLL